MGKHPHGWRANPGNPAMSPRTKGNRDEAQLPDGGKRGEGGVDGQNTVLHFHTIYCPREHMESLHMGT